MKPVTALTLLVVSFVALMHALRLVVGTTVTIAGIVLPVWVSAPAALLFGALAVGLWREHRRPGPPTP